MWLRRFIERIEQALDGDGAKRQRAVGLVLERRKSYRDDDALLDALLELMPADAPLCEASLAHIARALRVGSSCDIAPHASLRFWRTLAERFSLEPAQLPDSQSCTAARAFVHACFADALLAFYENSSDGDDALVLERFLLAAELEPGLVPEFGDPIAPIAERAGGVSWLRFQLVDLRARIDDPEQADDVRERYSELLSEHRNDSVALGHIRPVGKLINRLTEANLLPRVLIRRGD